MQKVFAVHYEVEKKELWHKKVASNTVHYYSIHRKIVNAMYTWVLVLGMYCIGIIKIFLKISRSNVLVAFVFKLFGSGRGNTCTLIATYLALLSLPVPKVPKVRSPMLC